MIRKFLLFAVFATASYFLIAGNQPHWENLIKGPDMSIEVDSNSLKIYNKTVISKFRINFFDEENINKTIVYTMEQNCNDDKIYITESNAFYDNKLVEQNKSKSELRFISTVFSAWFSEVCRVV